MDEQKLWMTLESVFCMSVERMNKVVASINPKTFDNNLQHLQSKKLDL
jgi:hypothetical protein